MLSREADKFVVIARRLPLLFRRRPLCRVGPLRTPPCQSGPPNCPPLGAALPPHLSAAITATQLAPISPFSGQQARAVCANSASVSCSHESWKLNSHKGARPPETGGCVGRPSARQLETEALLAPPPPPIMMMLICTSPVKMADKLAG